jgi:hypothetical protein
LAPRPEFGVADLTFEQMQLRAGAQPAWVRRHGNREYRISPIPLRKEHDSPPDLELAVQTESKAGFGETPGSEFWTESKLERKTKGAAASGVYAPNFPVFIAVYREGFRGETGVARQLKVPQEVTSSMSLNIVNDHLAIVSRWGVIVLDLQLTTAVALAVPRHVAVAQDVQPPKGVPVLFLYSTEDRCRVAFPKANPQTQTQTSRSRLRGAWRMGQP